MSTIDFAKTDDAWVGFRDKVERLIQQERHRQVLEIGGGANPTLPIAQIDELGLKYTVLDISEEELKKAPPGYLTELADICAPDFALRNHCDFAFSKMLAEHVPSGELFHRNIFKLLKPGGVAFHFFPTLYAAPFVVNRLIPERFSEWLLGLLMGRRERSGQHGKFPAYYSWCRGPTKSQIERLQSVGFEIVEYTGFFGHAGYYSKIPPLKSAHNWLSDLLLRNKVAMQTSYAYLVVRKPG